MRYLSKEHLAVLDAVSTDETRYILTGVKLEETEKGLKAIATDGRIMAIVESETKLNEDDFPVIPSFKDAPNSSKAAIIAVAALKQAIKGVKKSRVPVLSQVAVKLSDTTSTLASTDLETHTVVPTKNIEGNYPNYDQVIPKDEVKTFSIAFNPAYLEIAGRIANKVMDRNSVTLQFSDATSPVKIVGKRGDFTVTIVLMPMKV